MDLTPTLLEAPGVTVPATIQGYSFLPLLDRRTKGWRNEVYFEMTESSRLKNHSVQAVKLRKL